MAQTPAAPVYNVPVTYYKLPNGLKVVLSRDATAPTVVVAVYYNIGFRIEPKDRTGFAHLFEHMMFQGSENLGKMEFIQLVQRNGGVLNGSTRFDFTNYFEVVPAHKLETMLWAEADRMRGLDITQDNLTNQQGVVGNEVKVNVLNQPYGGFPWLDMPQYANTNWYNAHNFYGDLKDIEAATLDDVQDFFKTYYAPNNAALVVVGDFDEAQREGAWSRSTSAAYRPQHRPPQPDLTEPRQDRARSASTKTDPLATQAGARHSPTTCRRATRPSTTRWGCSTRSCCRGRQHAASGTGQEARLHGRGRAAASTCSATCSTTTARCCGSASLIHDRRSTPDADPGDRGRSDRATFSRRRWTRRLMDRALVKLRSSALRRPGPVRRIRPRRPAGLLRPLRRRPGAHQSRSKTSSARSLRTLIQKTAQEYLRPTNRTVLIVEPGQAAPAAQE